MTGAIRAESKFVLMFDYFPNTGVCVRERERETENYLDHSRQTLDACYERKNEKLAPPKQQQQQQTNRQTHTNNYNNKQANKKKTTTINKQTNKRFAVHIRLLKSQKSGETVCPSVELLAAV